MRETLKYLWTSHRPEHRPCQTAPRKYTYLHQISKKLLESTTNNTNLAISLMGDWDICVVTLVVTRIHSTKHSFTTFSFISMTVKPERENRVIDETLLYHVIPVICLSLGTGTTKLRYITIIPHIHKSQQTNESRCNRVSRTWSHKKYVNNSSYWHTRTLL
jgi:hypothetical protein